MKPTKDVLLDDKTIAEASARSLVGKLVRFNHQPDGPYHLVNAARGAMVEIEDIPGLFAPHLFRAKQEEPC